MNTRDEPALKKIAQERPLRERVADAITDAILTGRLEPGQKIPEQELANQLGVSRIPVREAVRILEQQGMVESRPRSGTYVTLLSLSEIEDAYRLRAALEEFALSEAFDILTEEEWETLCNRLDAIMQEMWEAEQASQWTRFTRLDLAWHTLQIDAAGNTVLSQTWRHLGFPLRFMAANRRYWKIPVEERSSTVSHHEELLAALRSRDLAEIQTAIRRHCLRRVRSRVAGGTLASDV